MRFKNLWLFKIIKLQAQIYCWLSKLNVFCTKFNCKLCNKILWLISALNPLNKFLTIKKGTLHLAKPLRKRFRRFLNHRHLSFNNAYGINVRILSYNHIINSSAPAWPFRADICGVQTASAMAFLGDRSRSRNCPWSTWSCAHPPLYKSRAALSCAQWGAPVACQRWSRSASWNPSLSWLHANGRRATIGVLSG